MEIYEASLDKSLGIVVGDIVRHCGSYFIISYDYNEDMFPFGLTDLKTGDQYNYMRLESIISEIDMVCKNKDTKLELNNVKKI